MEIWDNLKKKFSFLLAFVTVRIQYMTRITYKIRVNRLLRLSVRLPVNSRLSVANGGGSKVIHWIFDCVGS